MLQGSINQADGLNAVRGLYSFNGKGSSFFHSITTFFYSGIGAAAIPARLRLRKNFGERSFSPMAVIISLCFYIYITFNVFLLGLGDEEEGFPILLASGMFFFLIIPFNSFTFFIIQTIVKSYKHFKAVYSKKEHDTYRYSYYRGDPISNKYDNKIGTVFFGFEVDEKLIRMYFEPRGFALKHLIIGLVLIVSTISAIPLIIVLAKTEATFAMILGFLTILLYSYAISNLCLSISGFCLLLEELAIAKKIRDSVLDMYDGEYDMKFLMKQKELLERKNIESESVDIAESVFQNPEAIDMVLLPTFNPFDSEPQVNNFVTKTPLNKNPDTTTKGIEDTPSKSKNIKKQPQNKSEGDTDLDNFMAKIME